MPRMMNKTFWPYQITVKSSTIEELNKRKKWLHDYIILGWYINGDTYCFKDEKQYLYFRLVWE